MTSDQTQPARDEPTDANRTGSDAPSSPPGPRPPAGPVPPPPAQQVPPPGRAAETQRLSQPPAAPPPGVSGQVPPGHGPFGPAPAGPPPMPSPAAGGSGPPGSSPTQPFPAGPHPAGAPAGPMASPTPGAPAPGQVPPGWAGPPPGYPPGPPGQPGAPYQGAPQPPTARPNRKWLIVGLLVAAGVLLIAGIGFAIFASSGPNYAIGSCVARDGDAAKPVGCSATGAYQITKQVDDQRKCPDQNQPAVVLSTKGKPDQVLCLKPAK